MPVTLTDEEMPDLARRLTRRLLDRLGEDLMDLQQDELVAGADALIRRVLLEAGPMPADWNPAWDL